jgi:hypothetical protein
MQHGKSIKNRLIAHPTTLSDSFKLNIAATLHSRGSRNILYVVVSYIEKRAAIVAAVIKRARENHARESDCKV